MMTMMMITNTIFNLKLFSNFRDETTIRQRGHFMHRLFNKSRYCASFGAPCSGI